MAKIFPKISYSLCLCLIPITLPAQDVTSTFTGVSGHWNDSDQWSPAQVPDNTETTTYEVLIDGGNPLDSTLHLGGINPTVSSLTIDSGDTLNVQSERQLTIDGDTLTNNGTLNLDSQSQETYLIFKNGAEIEGTGVIELSNSQGNMLLVTTQGETLINGSGHTIRGSGTFLDNIGGLTNEGQIICNSSAGLRINPGTGTVVNTGSIISDNSQGMHLLEGDYTNEGSIIVRNNGKIFLNGSNIDNSSGTITVEMGLLEIRTGTTTGGTISGTPGQSTMRIIQSGHTFNSAELNIDVMHLPGADITINDSLTINKAWNFQAASIGTSIVSTTDTAFNGSGIISMVSSAYHLLYGDNVTQTFGSDLTIKGAGNLGYNKGGIVINGTVLANHAQALIIDPNGLGCTINGTVSATGAGGLTLRDGTHTNVSHQIAIEAGSKLTLESNAILTSTGNPIELKDDGKVILRGSILTTSTIDETGTEAGLLDLFDGSNTLRIGSINTDVLQRAGADVTIEGDLEQNGDWTMQAASIGMDVKFLGDATFSGEGTLNCISGAYHLIYSDGGILTMGEDRTIKGAGKICNNKGGMINNGTIYAYADDALTINPNDAGFVNNGHLIVSGEGGMIFQSGIATNTSNPIEIDRRTKMILTDNVDLQSETQPINLASAGRIIFRDGRLAASLIDGPEFARIEIETSNNTLSAPIVNIDINQLTQADIVIQGDLEHNGLWTMLPGSLGMDAEFDPGAVFGGNGELIMQSEAYHNVYSNNGLLVHDADHTIRGVGKVCNRKGGLENHGLVRAEGDNKTLKIEPNSLGSLNLGIWEVGPLATMHVYNETSKPFHNMIDSIELFDGTYSVEGKLRLDKSNVEFLSANLILIGPDARVINDELLNITDEMHTITTQGTLDLRSGHIMETNVDSGDFLNLGTILISSGSDLRVNTSIDQRMGLTQLNNGILTTQSDFINSMGILKGTGTVSASVTNNLARVEPGLDAETGTLTITGNCSFDFFSTLAVDIIGTGDGEYDKLVVSGTADLDGYLEGWFPGGYNPPIGTRFPVLDAAPRQETFKFLTGTNVADGPYFILEYSPTGAELVITDIYITSQEVIDHLRGYINLTGAKAALADDNGDGQLDSADVTSLINKGL